MQHGWKYTGTGENRRGPSGCDRQMPQNSKRESIYQTIRRTAVRVLFPQNANRCYRDTVSEILASTPIHALVELLCTPSLDHELKESKVMDGYGIMIIYIRGARVDSVYMHVQKAV